jgi:hypothetical protein
LLNVCAINVHDKHTTGFLGIAKGSENYFLAVGREARVIVGIVIPGELN